MSKRKREGPTLLASKRSLTHEPAARYWPNALISSSSSSTDTMSGSVLGKRAFEEPESVSRKCPYTEVLEPRGQKRTADFDLEIDRLHKRLRATTPTAEEAIGFLLPHLLELRRLYLMERQKVVLLKEDNDILRKNNSVITQTLRDQLSKKNLIQRQLDLALYRLSLVRDRNSF